MQVPFSTLEEFRAALAAQPAPDSGATEAAIARNNSLTKPPGALGRLEELSIWFAGWQGTAKPRIDAAQVVIFAGNHGIAARGVSAFPTEVTAQMVQNFEAEGAAINQLASCYGASMKVHAIELDRPTVDFTVAPAMDEEDFLAALMVGWESVDPDAQLLVVGEMGIGNTTSAAAIAMALYGGAPADWVGRGTGVDDAGLARKVEVVAAGVALHASGDALTMLRCLGGREIAAMAGAIAAARHGRVPVILDGFICCAAAAVLAQAQPGALDHTIAGHQSAEAAHSALLIKLNKVPLLSLGLRLGEGSGAAMALGVLKGALACQSGMASFAEANVSEGGVREG